MVWRDLRAQGGTVIGVFLFRSFISYLRALVPLHKRKVASVGIYPSIRTSQRLIDHISVYVTLR
jgi:hypothetical protein